MINNIANVNARVQQSSIIKPSMAPHTRVVTPPVLSFKVPLGKEKAILRVKKFKRGDNIIIAGEIDDDYVDIIEEKERITDTNFNFFHGPIQMKKTKYLKNSYVIDYIQSPKMGCGLGTEALKGLAEKAFFDSKAEGRIVTYCAPVWQESSPAQFFYKLGFRFMDPDANEYIKDCINKKIPDLPPQTGMMYLPKNNLHKLLRYGEKF